MPELICRDCGLTLPSNARGCPRCAWNLEVENKFDRIVWFVGTGLAIVVAGLLILFALYRSRL